MGGCVDGCQDRIRFPFAVGLIRPGQGRFIEELRLLIETMVTLKVSAVTDILRLGLVIFNPLNMISLSPNKMSVIIQASKYL